MSDSSHPLPMTAPAASKRSYPVPPPPSRKDLVVLREKLKVEHVDPDTRHTYREFALRNDADDARTEWLVVLADFLPGLWIEDGHGNELTYLPMWLVEKEIGPREDILAELDTTGDRSKQQVLVIHFAQPVPPGDSIVLRLHYQDEESRGQIYNVIPKNWFKQGKPKTAEYFDTFIEIAGPPDSRIIVPSRPPGVGMPSMTPTRWWQRTPEQKEQGQTTTWSTADGVKVNRQSNFLQVRLPAGHPRVEFRYRVAPLLSEFWLIKISFHLLWLIPLAMLILSFAGPVLLSTETATAVATEPSIVIQLDETHAGELAGTLGIAAIIGIVAFLRPIWTNRLLWLWPFACNLAVLVASQL